MTFYTASFETVTLRFALMMAVIIGAFVIQLPILGVLGLPIFLSAMMAVSFKSPSKNVAVNMSVKQSDVIEMGQQAA